LSASGSGSRTERLLIVRLGAMGDVIHTLPAVQALREAFPHAMIGWLIEERWAELLCAAGVSRRGPRSPQRPLVDWVHTVNLRAWRKSLFGLHTLEKIATVWNDVRSVGYDAAVDLQGAIRSAILARLAGAPMVWGSSEPRESPASLWYTRQATVRGAHVIEQNLSIAEAIAGKQMSVSDVKFPYDQATERHIQCDLTQQGIRKYAILNPGAGWGAKRWPAERYGEIARQLSDDGLTPIVNFGPGEEYLAKEVVAASAGRARAMNFSISELIALTREAKLFIGGDTGPLHLAAALQVPVVAIFGPTDPARNGPYRTRSVVLRNPVSVTSHSRRAQPDEAMLEIGVDVVVTAARSLLTNSSAKRTHTENG
jgi:heptosyltransferase I